VNDTGLIIKLFRLDFKMMTKEMVKAQ